MAEHVHRAAVLGKPIAHSLSPALHLAAYASLGLPWTYEAIEVDEAGLAGVLAGLDGSWAGLSLTMPLKEEAARLLTDVDPTARALRSVNTVLPGPEGWRGTNTDVYGMTTALERAGLAGAPAAALVLGAGATARSAVAALAALGAGHVTVAARRVDAASEVASVARRLGLPASTADLTPDPDLITLPVVVSTLPGAAAEPWAALAPSARGVLLDASYHPWPTPLAASWGSGSVASGRDMLLWQAVEQVRLMTGREPSVEAMAAALPA
jgi:shikimate dehydrogenase